MQTDCILHIHLEKLQLKVIPSCLGVPKPISSFLAVTKAGNGCCKLPFIKPQKKKIQNKYWKRLQV